MGELDAASVNKEVCATFRSGRTRSISWRINQLKAIGRLLEEREAEIGDCLMQDLGKSAFESYCTESNSRGAYPQLRVSATAKPYLDSLSP